MALLRKIWGLIKAAGNWLWRWGYVIWVCRVAVASAAAGGILLAYTEQARDLFADLGVTNLQWVEFFVLLVSWACLVHAGGRRALQHDAWVPEWHAQDGLSDKRRQELQEDYWYPALLVPRVLSFVVLGCVGFAIFRVYLNLGSAAPGLPEAEQAVTLAWNLLAATFAVAVALLIIWLFKERRVLWDWIVSDVPLRWCHKPPLLAGTLPIPAPRSTARLTAWWTRDTRPPPPDAPWEGVPLEWAEWFLIGVCVVIVVLLLFTIYYPHYFADWLLRLFFIPVLFGGAVVLLGEVAAWSTRLRTPLLLVIVVIGLFAVFWTESFHDTRWIETTVEPSKAAGDERQISLADAVERWKAANKCAGSGVTPCPRPILTAGAGAGAGGASRAGFFTATVVGALIDLGLDETRGAPYGDIRSRIFALSTVSGSSAGAAVMRAALLDAAARGDPNTPPCTTAGTGSWFGQPLMATDKTFNPMKNWRDCFQAILVGDFLSPIFVALAFRDNFPFINPLTGRPAWPDRAVLLEQALERRYHRFTTDDGKEFGVVPGSAAEDRL